MGLYGKLLENKTPIYNFAYRRFRKRIPSLKKAKEFLDTIEMQPSSRKHFYGLAKRDEDFRIALFKNESKQFYTEFDYIIDHVQNTFVYIQGRTGSGKTTAAKSIVTYYKNRVKNKLKKDISIHLVYDNDQVTQAIKQTKPFDFIFRDEDQDDEGLGSNLAEKAIRNFNGIIRDQHINSIYLSPFVIQGKTAQIFKIYLMSLGYIKETGQNILVWLDREAFKNTLYFYPSSIIYIKKLPNLQLQTKIDEQKAEKQSYLKETGGHSYQSFDSDQLEKDYKKLITYIDNNKIYGRITQKAIFAKVYECGVKNTNEKHLAALIGKIYNELKRREENKKSIKQEAKTVEIDYNDNSTDKNNDINYDVQLEKTFIDENFRELILKELKNLGVNDESIAIYDRIATGESYREIRDRLHISSLRVISHAKKEIQEKYLGDAGEAAYKKRLESLGYTYEHFGGNSPLPDFVVHSLKEIHSFKSYTLENDSKSTNHIATTEFVYAQKLNYKLKLVEFIIKENMFKIFNVSFQNLPICDSIEGDEKSNSVEKREQKTPPLSALLRGSDSLEGRVEELKERYRSTEDEAEKLIILNDIKLLLVENMELGLEEEA